MSVSEGDEKPSPGPWKACDARGGLCQCGIVWSIPNDIPVATVHGKSSEEGEGDTPEAERLANARLIASAPDLLAELTEALGLLSRYVVRLPPQKPDSLDGKTQAFLTRPDIAPRVPEPEPEIDHPR